MSVPDELFSNYYYRKLHLKIIQKLPFLIYYKNGTFMWKPIKSEVRQLNVFSN